MHFISKRKMMFIILLKRHINIILKGETSRYWIKKSLLEENIRYTFTELGIYKTGYDMSFLSAECRQPLTISKKINLLPAAFSEQVIYILICL